MKHFVISLFIFAFCFTPSAFATYTSSLTGVQIDGALISSAMPVGLSDLKAIAADTYPDGFIYRTKYRTTDGDGGGGSFRWVTGDQSADSGVLVDTQEGVYVKPSDPGDGSTGVWERQYSGEINVQWFGAVDGTDSTDALLAAFAFANVKPCSVYVPSGTYSTTEPLPISRSGFCLRGNGRSNSSIISSASSGIANDSGVAKNHIVIENIKIKTTAASAKAIDMSLFSYSTVSNITVEVLGNDSSAIYAAGTSAGSSPYYNFFENNYLAALSGATGCTGYLFDAYISGSLVRGPNSNTVTGGRIASMYRSIDVQAGNNNTFNVWSESPVGAGAHFRFGLDDPSYSGTATGGTISTLVDSAASFPSTLANGGVRIVSGTGAGQARKISSATSTTITTKFRWETAPDATSVYEVFAATVFDCSLSNCRAESGSSADVIDIGLSAHTVGVFKGHASTYGGDLVSQLAANLAFSIDGFGGYRSDVSQFSFYVDDVAASLTSSDAVFLGQSNSILLADNFDIIGISVRTSAARTAGTLTVNPKINGTLKTEVGASINSNATQNNVQYYPEGTLNAGGSGRYLGVGITTSSDWAPITGDAVITVFVRWKS